MAQDEEKFSSPEDDTFAAIKTLVSSLSQAEKESLLRELTQSIVAIPAPRAGSLLSNIISVIPRDHSWSVQFIKKKINLLGIDASDKEIYNAIGYLTRRKHIKRIGYGRYVIDGLAITTADDLGGQPNITEGDLDD